MIMIECCSSELLFKSLTKNLLTVCVGQLCSFLQCFCVFTALLLSYGRFLRFLVRPMTFNCSTFKKLILYSSEVYRVT